MNATELRPPLDEAREDDATLERILLAGPEPSPSRRRRPAARSLAVVAATAVAATAGFALLPSGGSGAVGLARAVAALTQPDVLLHFKVTTTHSPSGAVETTEAWQTPDGRRSRTIYRTGLEIAYDQKARVYEAYAPERNEVIVQTDPGTFTDRENPLGSIATTATSNPSAVGDLPELVTRALGGQDPKVHYVGPTTIDGIDVDQIRIDEDVELAAKTVTVVRDVYVRHDNALPVRVVDHLGALGGTNPNATSTSEFTDVQKLTLDASTEPTLKLDHPDAQAHGPGPV
jgi:hypothetical protein